MRVSMTEVVKFLRQYGQAAADDVFNGETYWSDEQLEALADRWSQPAVIELIPTQTIGRTKYKLKLRNHYLMENSFLIYNDVQVAVSSPVGTWDSVRGLFTFGANLSDTTTYYVEAQFTNAYEALADLWAQKADQRFDYIDWKAQNNKMNMKEEYDHCVERASFYRNKIVRRFTRQKSRWTI